MQNFVDAQETFAFPEYLFPATGDQTGATARLLEELPPASQRRAVVLAHTPSQARVNQVLAHPRAGPFTDVTSWAQDLLEFHATWGPMPGDAVALAMRLLEPLARGGDDQAAYLLGTWGAQTERPQVQSPAHSQPHPHERFYVNSTDQRTFLRQALKHGVTGAWYRVAMNANERGDVEQALSRFQRGADKNDPACLYTMGLAHMQGQFGLPPDVERGLNLIELSLPAASTEFPRAPYLLGKILLGEGGTGSNGLGIEGVEQVPLRPSFGMDLVERSARLGFAPALLRMADAYLDGEAGPEGAAGPSAAPGTAVNNSVIGGTRDFNSAVALRLLSLAADQDTYRRSRGEAPLLGGQPESQIVKWLLCGYDGVIRRNEEWAFHFAEVAALDQNGSGLFALAYFHEVGIATPQDSGKAAVLYQLSADRGFTPALARLGQLQTGTPSLRRSLTRREHEVRMKKHSAALMRGTLNASEAIADESTMQSDLSPAMAAAAPLLNADQYEEFYDAAPGVPMSAPNSATPPITGTPGHRSGPVSGPVSGPDSGPTTGPTPYPRTSPRSDTASPPRSAPYSAAGVPMAPPSGSNRPVTSGLPYPSSPRRHAYSRSANINTSSYPDLSQPSLSSQAQFGSQPSLHGSIRSVSALPYPVDAESNVSSTTSLPYPSSPERRAASVASDRNSDRGSDRGSIRSSALPYPIGPRTRSAASSSSSVRLTDTDVPMGPVSGPPMSAAHNPMLSHIAAAHSDTSPPPVPPQPAPAAPQQQLPSQQPSQQSQQQQQQQQPMPPLAQPSPQRPSSSALTGPPLTKSSAALGRSREASPDLLGLPPVPPTKSKSGSSLHSRMSSLSMADSAAAPADGRPRTASGRSASPRRRPISTQWVSSLGSRIFSQSDANSMLSASSAGTASTSATSLGIHSSTSAGTAYEAAPGGPPGSVWGGSASGSAHGSQASSINSRGSSPDPTASLAPGGKPPSIDPRRLDQKRAASPLRKMFGSTPEQRAAAVRADRRSFTEAALAELQSAPKVPVQPINTDRIPGVAYTFEEMGIQTVASNKSDKCEVM